jgi:hypothetical protein
VIDINTASAEILREADFEVAHGGANDRGQLTFESSTVIGFLFAYSSVSALLENWEKDSNGAVSAHQHALRRAGQKAWNTYTVLLTADIADVSQSASISSIEEDLSGTRKIVRAGVVDNFDVRAALLPLLPLQSSPRLESVDSAKEIASRATELSPKAIEAFLSPADEATVLLVLEEGT